MDIANYIKQAQRSGFTTEQIRAELQTAGWSEEQIDYALAPHLSRPVPPPPPVAPPASVSHPASEPTTMWDTFEHILLFISLYVMAISGALLLHSFVDMKMPPVDQYYDSDYPNTFIMTAIRFYLSALIVSFPLFSVLFIRLTKQTRLRPELRRLRARKKLIYLTLVVTFIFLITELIRSIFSLLEGNIGMSFFLHFLITAGISGTIFGYYYHQVKHDRTVLQQL